MSPTDGGEAMPSRGSAPADAGERDLVMALRRGDEPAFMAIVERYHGSLVRAARMYVASDAVAEEVAQETWIGVLRGIDRFEGRSSFKSWLYSILINIAKTRGQREGRSIPFSSAVDRAGPGDERSVDPDRFLPPDHDRWPATGH